MRRHREHGSREHGEHREQAADQVERHREVGNRLTDPIEFDGSALRVAEINQRDGVFADLGIGDLEPDGDGTRAAFRLAPHVGILELDLAFGRVGLPLGRSLLHGERAPIGKTGDARVLGTGDPAIDIAAGADDDAYIGGFAG